MATDRNAKTISVGTDYVVAGRCVAVSGSDVVIDTGRGPIQVDAADVIAADDANRLGGKITTGSGTITVTVADSVILADAGDSPVTVSLYDHDTAGARWLRVKKIDTTGGPITISVSVDSSIDGQSSLILDTPYMAVDLIPTSTGWMVF